LINDAAAIGRVARAAGVPYFIDAGQGDRQLSIDVVALGGRHAEGNLPEVAEGTRGTPCSLSEGIFLPSLEPAFLDVQSGTWVNGGPCHGRTSLFETIETSIALQLGLGRPASAHALGIPVIRERINMLADGFARAGIDDQRRSIPTALITHPYPQTDTIT